MLILRTLQPEDEEAFLKGLKEWEGEEPHWYSFLWNAQMTYPEMLTKLRDEEAGRNLAPGRVPHTMYYAFLESEIVGRVSLRHELNEYLLQRGGHLGYAVAPRFRRQGHATEMFRQVLQKCEQKDLRSLLVTCADDNIPSWKMIERFGGRLENKIWDDEDGEMIRRYWIQLT